MSFQENDQENISSDLGHTESKTMPLNSQEATPITNKSFRSHSVTYSETSCVEKNFPICESTPCPGRLLKREFPNWPLSNFQHNVLNDISDADQDGSSDPYQFAPSLFAQDSCSISQNIQEATEKSQVSKLVLCQYSALEDGPDCVFLTPTSIEEFSYNTASNMGCPTSVINPNIVERSSQISFSNIPENLEGDSEQSSKPAFERTFIKESSDEQIIEANASSDQASLTPEPVQTIESKPSHLHQTTIESVHSESSASSCEELNEVSKSSSSTMVINCDCDLLSKALLHSYIGTKSSDYLEENNSTILNLVSTYEAMVRGLIYKNAYNERMIDDLTIQNESLISDYASLASCFNNLNIRFERLRIISKGLLENENVLKQQLKVQDEMLKAADDRFFSLKAHSEEKLIQSFKDFEQSQQLYKSKLHLLEMKINEAEIQKVAAEASLERKQEECVKLQSICDGLLASAEAQFVNKI